MEFWLVTEFTTKWLGQEVITAAHLYKETWRKLTWIAFSFLLNIVLKWQQKQEEEPGQEVLHYSRGQVSKKFKYTLWCETNCSDFWKLSTLLLNNMYCHKFLWDRVLKGAINYREQVSLQLVSQRLFATQVAWNIAACNLQCNLTKFNLAK